MNASIRHMHRKHSAYSNPTCALRAPFASAVRIRAFDCTLVDKHMCSREGVLGSNPTTPKLFPKVSVARRRLLRNAPWNGHHSRYITLFFKGAYSVIGFYELMRMVLVSLMHFLR